MQPIGETGSHEFLWRQPRRRASTYDLYAGEYLVATLSWQRGSRAEARTASGQWTFERTGFWHARVRVRGPSPDASCITFTPRWTGAGNLECAGERRFRWTPANFWQTQWVWQAADGTLLMRIRRNPKITHGGHTAKALVELMPAADDLPELPLLILLGWYLVLLHARTVAATTAANVAAISR